jgi:lysophospholipase L1-like esterase
LSGSAFALWHGVKVAIIGDSLAAGTGDENDGGIAGRLPRELPSAETINLGVSGAVTADLLRRLKQPDVRAGVQSADAIVLSIGANDLFRMPGVRERALQDPLAVGNEILDRIAAIVDELRRLNPHGHIFLLGGYNPVPDHPLASLIDVFLAQWDEMLSRRFDHDPRVSVLQTSDIVIGKNLSRYDRFHPGAPAYAAMAKRIAAMIRELETAA